jgi:NADH:ubiquinone oxidoreductase subunit 4 (subunit M)
MGGYGFLRFNLPITPDASRQLDLIIIALSLIAVVYIGFVALVQQDMKKLIAYSSIAHMGFVTLGAFLVYQIVRNTGGLQGAGMGLDGAMVQMISHGLVSGCSFVSACSMTGCIAGRFQTTAASSTPCRFSRPSWCCSRLRISVCRAPRALSANSW